MDWGEYPTGYKDKIDTWGVNGDCDDLQWAADNWWQKDRALGEYIYERLKLSGLCADVYYTPKCRRQALAGVQAKRDQFCGNGPRAGRPEVACVSGQHSPASREIPRR